MQLFFAFAATVKCYMISVHSLGTCSEQLSVHALRISKFAISSQGNKRHARCVLAKHDLGLWIEYVPHCLALTLVVIVLEARRYLFVYMYNSSRSVFVTSQCLHP